MEFCVIFYAHSLILQTRHTARQVGRSTNSSVTVHISVDSPVSNSRFIQMCCEIFFLNGRHCQEVLSCCKDGKGRRECNVEEIIKGSRFRGNSSFFANTFNVLCALDQWYRIHNIILTATAVPAI